MLARDLIQYATDALGGNLPTGISGVSVVNQAARLVEGLRRWRYLERSTKAIAFRDPVSGEAAGYDLLGTGSNALTLAGAFTGYAFLPGDTARVTNASGSVGGVYAVKSRVDDDSITLDFDVTGPVTGLAFTLDTARVALPSDFGRLVKVYGVESFTRSAFPSNSVELMQIDTHALTQNNFVTGYTLEWNQATATTKPVPTLKVWPQPSESNFEALAAVYIRSWPEIVSDESELPIPPYMESLMIQAVRAYAMGYDGGVDLSEAVQNVLRGPVFDAAVAEDAAGQRDSGRVLNRAVRPSEGRAYDPLGGVRTEALFLD